MLPAFPMNKSSFLLPITVYTALLSLALISQTALAKEISSKTSVDYTFEYKGVKSAPLEGYDLLSVEDTHIFGEVGAPQLPARQIRILLPYGTSIASLEVEGQAETLRGTYSIPSVQPAIQGDTKPTKESRVYNSTIYALETPFPDKLCPNWVVQKMRGYSIVMGNVYPVQYIPKTGEVLFYRNLTVNVQLQSAKPSSLYRGLQKDRVEVLSFVDNPEATYSYPEKKYETQGYDGVIITTSAMQSAYQSLVDHKETLGLNLQIALVSDILSSTQGFDDADKIRNYILKEYTENSIIYAILGGDVDAIPVRLLWTNLTSEDLEELSASDLYYGCLDGDFDEDEDGRLGEFHNDGSDFVAEVYVGRIPSDTAAEATGIINKIISFESSPRTNKATLHASMMNDDDSSKDIKEGNEFTDDIGVHDYLPDDYSVHTMYQPDVTPTLSEYKTQWNEGLMFFNHLGHGMETGYSVSRITSTEGDFFRATDADALSNDVYPIHTSQSCRTGRFDYAAEDCLAERLLLNPSGGSVANVQNSRNGYYDLDNPAKLSGELDIAFYKAVFADAAPSMGHAVQWARQAYAAEAHSNSTYNRIVFRWNLLGDPTMKVLDGDISLAAVVTSPNGGEQYLPSSVHDITWNTLGGAGEKTVTIELSTEGEEGPFVLVADAEEDDGEYSWETPSVESDACYIKVTVTDGEDTATDLSNAAFTISKEIDTDTGGDGDADGDSDTDGDSDADSDGDADGDSDADSDSDGDDDDDDDNDDNNDNDDNDDDNDNDDTDNPDDPEATSDDGTGCACDSIGRDTRLNRSLLTLLFLIQLVL